MAKQNTEEDIEAWSPQQQVEIVRKHFSHFWSPLRIFVTAMGCAIFVGNLFYFTYIVPARTNTEIFATILLFLIGLSLMVLGPMSGVFKILLKTTVSNRTS